MVYAKFTLYMESLVGLGGRENTADRLQRRLRYIAVYIILNTWFAHCTLLGHNVISDCVQLLIYIIATINREAHQVQFDNKL